MGKKKGTKQRPASYKNNDTAFIAEIKAEIDLTKEKCLVGNGLNRPLKGYVLGEGFEDIDYCLNIDCTSCTDNEKCVGPKTRKALRNLLRKFKVIAIIPEEMALGDPAFDQEQIIREDEYDFLFMVSTRGAQSLPYEFGSYAKEPNSAGKIVLFVPKKYYPFTKPDGLGEDIDSIIDASKSTGESLLTNAYLKQEIEHGHVYPYDDMPHLLYMASRFIQACQKAHFFFGSLEGTQNT